MSEKVQKGGHISKLFVPLVVAVGAIIGVVAFVIANAIAADGSSGSGDIFVEAFRGTHVVLTTVTISLLVALLYVYTKTYLATKAHFALGMWLVLLALLLRFVFTYPIFLDFTQHLPLLQNFFSPISDAFTVIAFSLFLYLSLE